MCVCLCLCVSCGEDKEIIRKQQERKSAGLENLCPLHLGGSPVPTYSPSLRAQAPGTTRAHCVGLHVAE